MILVYNHPLIFIAFEEGGKILHPGRPSYFQFPLERRFKTLWPQYIDFHCYWRRAQILLPQYIDPPPHLFTIPIQKRVQNTCIMVAIFWPPPSPLWFSLLLESGFKILWPWYIENPLQKESVIGGEFNIPVLCP